MIRIGRTAVFACLALALLSSLLIAASSCTPLQAKSLPHQQPTTKADPLTQRVTPLPAVNQVSNRQAPGPQLLPTPVPDPGSMGGAGGRPLGVTLLGLSVLFTCALGPTLIIVVILGFVIRANRQRQIAATADRNPGSSASGQEQ